MDAKGEWKKLAVIVAVFAGCFYLPVGFGRFDNAVTEELPHALTRARPKGHHLVFWSGHI